MHAHTGHRDGPKALRNTKARGPVDSRNSLWIPATTCGFPQQPVDSRNNLWIPATTCGFPQQPVDSRNNLWIPAIVSINAATLLGTSAKQAPSRTVLLAERSIR
jgi:hypothetical protein